MTDWIEIGKIVAPQGLKGEVRINPDSDFPERFLKPGLRWLQCPGSVHPQPIDLLKGYSIPGKNLYVVTLEGIEDRNQAESLRGCKLLVSAGDRPQLEEEEYHVVDLIDVEVYHHLTREYIGVVTNLFTAGNDLLEVQLSSSSAQTKPSKALIPFVKEIVPIVDLRKKRIEINPPPGLLEVNLPSQ